MARWLLLVAFAVTLAGCPIRIPAPAPVQGAQGASGASAAGATSLDR